MPFCVFKMNTIAFVNEGGKKCKKNEGGNPWESITYCNCVRPKLS